MTDYVRAYDNPSNPYHREARMLGDSLRTETIITQRGIEAGVILWKSNGRVVPKDCAALAYSLGLRVNLHACDIAREREDADAISRYLRARANRSPEQIAEERAEARAAFGPGAKVVNVFSGETIRT